MLPDVVEFLEEFLAHLLQNISNVSSLCVVVYIMTVEQSSRCTVYTPRILRQESSRCTVYNDCTGVVILKCQLATRCRVYND